MGLNLKPYECVVKAYDGPFKVSTTPMVDLIVYVFKYLNTGKITPEYYFTNDYVIEVSEL